MYTAKYILFAFLIRLKVVKGMSTCEIYIIISLHSQYSNTDSEDSTSDDTDFKSTAEDLNELQEDMSPTASQDSTATETSDKLISQKQQLQSKQ